MSARSGQGTAVCFAMLLHGCSDATVGLGDLGVAVDAGVYQGERMVRVPAGAFFMGCNRATCPPEDTSCCSAEELPQHEVVTPAFRIDVTETTVATFRACVRAGACEVPDAPDERCNFPHADREDHPMNCLGPAGAQAVCAFQGKRLCSEAEWEKAAVGGCELHGPALCALSVPRYVHGARSLASDCAFLNHDERAGLATGPGCGRNQTSRVDAHPLGRSPYGVLALNGNAAEITADCFATDFTATPRDGSAHRAVSCELGPTVRGGSFVSTIEESRTWRRRAYASARAEATCCGVRCCRDE